MPRKRFELGRDAMFLAVITFLTVLTWLGYEIYDTLHQTTISEATQKQMQPLNPRLETTVIDGLENSLTFSETELNYQPPATTSGQLE